MEKMSKYKEQNSKHYTNNEFLAIIQNSKICEEYYKENYGKTQNGFYLAPETKQLMDSELVSNMQRIIEYSKNEKKLELINKIMNECLIVEREPEYEYHHISLGSYFVKENSISPEMINAINNAGYKIRDEKFVPNQINTQNNKDLELMLENE